MQFSGFWVSLNGTDVIIDKAVFDETELTQESNWKEACQNLDSDARVRGYVEIKAAIRQAAKLIAKINQIDLSETEIEILLNDNTENLAISDLARKLIALSTGYKLSTLDDLKVLNTALNL